MPRILEGKRIFCVEDNVVNLSVYKTCLKKSGAHILQDAFGYGIITHIVENLPIDLIVLDIMLSKGIDGYQIYDEIRKNPQLKHIAVVAATSLDPETEIPKAQAKGFDGFISKPINAWEFPQLLARVLDGEKIWVVSR